MTTLASIQVIAAPRTPRFSIARDGVHDESTDGICGPGGGGETGGDEMGGDEMGGGEMGGGLDGSGGQGDGDGGGGTEGRGDGGGADGGGGGGGGDGRRWMPVQLANPCITLAELKREPSPYLRPK
jgi:hypothetical protein